MLNVVLGKLLGITGVILATIITIFFMNFLWRTILLFRNYFKTMSLKQFLIAHLGWASAIVIAAGVTYTICNKIQLGSITQVIVNAIVCVIVPNVILLALFVKTKQFTEAKAFGIKILGHLLKKRTRG